MRQASLTVAARTALLCGPLYAAAEVKLLGKVEDTGWRRPPTAR